MILTPHYAAQAIQVLRAGAHVLVEKSLELPARVVVWTRIAFHRIETEDTVQAVLEWEGETLGSVHIGTAEGGRPARLRAHPCRDFRA